MLFVNPCKRVAAGSHLLVLLSFFSQAHMKAFLVSTLCLFCLFFFPCSLFLLSVVSYLSLCLISFVISILICIILYYLPFFPFLWHLFFLFLFFSSIIRNFIPLFDSPSFLCSQLFPSSLAFRYVLHFKPFPLSEVFVSIFFFSPSYSCPSFLLSASFCSGAGPEPACRPVLPANTQGTAAAKCLRAAGTAYFAL